MTDVSELLSTKVFPLTRRSLARKLLDAPLLHRGRWHAQDVSKSPLHATYELEDVTLVLMLNDDPRLLAADLKPNLPWADLHFEERVGGQPLNPAPSHLKWPWARNNSTHQSGGTQIFSHTYPERMWPKHASVNGHEGPLPDEHLGIRYRYGDLEDVVSLLVRDPLTRQAYLPIWFPEDTGAHHGGRVPCTLGYHFMLTDNSLSCRYYMRSCDFVRHLVDDVYLAARLTQWIVQRVNDAWEAIDHWPSSPPVPHSISPGMLRMMITSLHALRGDEHTLGKIARGEE